MYNNSFRITWEFDLYLHTLRVQKQPVGRHTTFHLTRHWLSDYIITPLTKWLHHNEFWLQVQSVFTYVRTHVYTRAHAYTYPRVHYIYTRVHYIYTRVHTYTYVHTYRHTYIHMYAYTYILYICMFLSATTVYAYVHIAVHKLHTCRYISLTADLRRRSEDCASIIDPWLHHNGVCWPKNALGEPELAYCLSAGYLLGGTFVLQLESRYLSVPESASVSSWALSHLFTHVHTTTCPKSRIHHL